MAENTNTEREALQAYLKDCDECQIVPDVGGAWHAAFQAGRASLAASVGSEPVAWGIFDSQGFYEAADGQESAERFCAHYNKRTGADPLKPYTAKPLYTHPSPPEGMVMVPLKFVQGFSRLAHNYSLRAVPPDYYQGTEGDAFSAAYRRCGQDLTELNAMFHTPPTSAADSRKGE